MSKQKCIEIEKPVMKKGVLEVTVVSNGSSSRMKISEKTLDKIKKSKPDLYKLTQPYFEKKKSPVAKKTEDSPIVSIEQLQEAIKGIKNASMKLEKDGKSYKVRAKRNLYYLHYSKKFRHIIGWNELKKSSMHIENEKQLNDIIEEIKSFAKQVK